MALGHAVRSLTIFLMFYIISVKPHGIHNVKKAKTTSLTNQLSGFFIGTQVTGSFFKALHVNTTRNKVKTSCIPASKQLILLLNLARPALLAKWSASLLIPSCGDISPNLGPSIAGNSKPKCTVCDKSIACNHRTVICKSCNLRFHCKCVGLFLKDYIIYRTRNRTHDLRIRSTQTPTACSRLAL